MCRYIIDIVRFQSHCKLFYVTAVEFDYCQENVKPELYLFCDIGWNPDYKIDHRSIGESKVFKPLQLLDCKSYT